MKVPGLGAGLGDSTTTAGLDGLVVGVALVVGLGVSFLGCGVLRGLRGGGNRNLDREGVGRGEALPLGGGARRGRRGLGVGRLRLTGRGKEVLRTGVASSLGLETMLLCELDRKGVLGLGGTLGAAFGDDGGVDRKSGGRTLGDDGGVDLARGGLELPLFESIVVTEGALLPPKRSTAVAGVSTEGGLVGGANRLAAGVDGVSATGGAGVTGPPKSELASEAAGVVVVGGADPKTVVAGGGPAAGGARDGAGVDGGPAPKKDPAVAAAAGGPRDGAGVDGGPAPKNDPAVAGTKGD